MDFTENCDKKNFALNLVGNYLAESIILSPSYELFRFYSYFKTSTFIKSKNCQNSMQFYGKSKLKISKKISLSKSMGKYLSESKISSISCERFRFYSHFKTSTFIKSKNLKKRWTLTRLYGKSVLLICKKNFTIEIMTQFSSKF